MDVKQEPGRLGMTFAAQADPSRRAIIARSMQGEAPLSELAERFDISLPAISRHLGVLEAAGLIGRGQEAQWRPRRLNAAPIREVAAWLDGFRRFWGGELREARRATH